jgi:hypothetical protein
VENGESYTLNYGPNGLSVADYVATQKRYRHLTPENIDLIQAEVDHDWEKLQKKF